MITDDRVKPTDFYLYGEGRYAPQPGRGLELDAYRSSARCILAYSQVGPKERGALWVSQSDKGLYRSQDGGEMFEPIAIWYSSGGLTTDLIHPSDHGMALIASRLSTALQAHWQDGCINK